MKVGAWEGGVLCRGVGVVMGLRHWVDAGEGEGEGGGVCVSLSGDFYTPLVSGPERGHTLEIPFASAESPATRSKGHLENALRIPQQACQCLSGTW